MKDCVISDGNEREFIKIAKRLGYSELVFIGSADVSKLKSKIKLSSSRRIFKSDIKTDRTIIESRRADIICDFESIDKKDGFHFLNSGLNHVIVKLMKEKKVSYGLSFSQLLGKSSKEQARILGRMMQNLKLCRKYKVPIVFGSFARHPYQMRDYRDLMAFARTLGLDSYKA